MNTIVCQFGSLCVGVHLFIETMTIVCLSSFTELTRSVRIGRLLRSVNEPGNRRPATLISMRRQVAKTRIIFGSLQLNECVPFMRCVVFSRYVCPNSKRFAAFGNELCLLINISNNNMISRLINLFLSLTRMITSRRVEHCIISTESHAVLERRDMLSLKKLKVIINAKINLNVGLQESLLWLYLTRLFNALQPCHSSSSNDFH